MKNHPLQIVETLRATSLPIPQNRILLFHHLARGDHLAVIHQFYEVNAGGIIRQVDLGCFARHGHHLQPPTKDVEQMDFSGQVTGFSGQTDGGDVRGRIRVEGEVAVIVGGDAGSVDRCDGEVQRHHTVAAVDGLACPRVVAAFGVGAVVPLVAAGLGNIDVLIGRIIDHYHHTFGAVAAVLVGADDRVGAGIGGGEGGIGGAVVPKVGLCAVGHERGRAALTNFGVASDIDDRQRIDNHCGGCRAAASRRTGASDGVVAELPNRVRCTIHTVAPLVRHRAIGRKCGGITLTYLRVAADGDCGQLIDSNVGGGRCGTTLRVSDGDGIDTRLRNGDRGGVRTSTPLINPTF